MRRLAALLVVPAAAVDGGVRWRRQAAPTPPARRTDSPAITAGAKFGEKPTLSKGQGDPPKELKTQVISEGNGATLKNGDAIQVNYLGQVWDSTKAFDNSFDRKQPLRSDARRGHGHQGLGPGPRRPEGRQPRRAGHPAGPRLRRAGQPQAGIKPQRHPGLRRRHPEGDADPERSAKGTAVAQDNVDLPKVGTNTDGKAPSVNDPEEDRPAEEAGLQLRPGGRRRGRQGDRQRRRAVQGPAVEGRQDVRQHVRPGQDARPSRWPRSPSRA